MCGHVVKLPQYGKEKVLPVLRDFLTIKIQLIDVFVFYCQVTNDHKVGCLKQKQLISSAFIVSPSVGRKSGTV